MSLNAFGFEGRTVVVTGAASGMGRAAATLLMQDGAEVHAIDLVPTDVGTTSYQVDLRDHHAVVEVAATIPAPDVLLNCAGLASLPDPLDVFRVNYIGLRRLTEELLPRMTTGSAVGNIASKAGNGWPSILDEALPVIDIDDDDAAAKWFADNPQAMADVYGYSKACVVIYTMARAAELVPVGIRMNAISPGASDTGFFGDVSPTEIPALRQSIAHVGRLSAPEEQALPLLFLCSDAASYVSGVNVIVDAGGQGGYVTGRLQPPDTPIYASIRRPPPQSA